MKSLIIFFLLISTSAFAQYNNQLMFVNGVQIKEDGEILYNKKIWDQKTKKKQNIILIENDKKIQTNSWDEGPVKILRKKNKIELKYKNINSKELEIEYVFQGAREENADFTSLTKFEGKKVINFTQCVGKKCLTLTPVFCQKLKENMGQDSNAAIEKAKQCMSFSRAMGNFDLQSPIIQDLHQVHIENLSSIDVRLNDYFEYKSNLSNNNEFELEKVIKLGDANQEYFNLLIQVLNSCEKNFFIL